jgi:hypothetical protein
MNRKHWTDNSDVLAILTVGGLTIGPPIMYILDGWKGVKGLLLFLALVFIVNAPFAALGWWMERKEQKRRDEAGRG